VIPLDVSFIYLAGGILSLPLHDDTLFPLPVYHTQTTLAVQFMS
jgi:hypothetical protein